MQNTVQTLRRCELGLHVSKIVVGLLQEKNRQSTRAGVRIRFEKNFWVN